jgi:hypothetical protein
LELIAQMTLAAGRDLELRVSVSTPDLTGGAVLAGFILAVLGGRQSLARDRHDCVVLGDSRLKLERSGIQQLYPRADVRRALEQTFDHRACLSRFSGGALMLSAERRR